MDRIIVFADDADYALQQLLPLCQDAQPRQWLLVACPPHLTRHASKWVNQSARLQWRERWSGKLFERIVPALRQRGGEIRTQIATESLRQVNTKLQASLGPTPVLDARRPKFGQDLSPLTADQPSEHAARWTLPGSVATLGAMLILAAD